MYTIRHPGLSCRLIAKILGVRETKATQASRPAIEKVARLLIADPIGTIVILAEAMIKAEQDLIREKLNNPQPGAAYPPTRFSTDRAGHH